MAHKVAVRVERVTEQTGVAESNRRPTAMIIQILLDGVVLPHEDIRKNDRVIDRRPVMSGNNKNGRPFDKLPVLDILQRDDPTTPIPEVDDA
jgi:hypothetical protein